MKFKACYKCNIKWPLFMFKTDRRKFKLPVALGKVRNCRICVYKESKDAVVRYNFEKNQFDKVKLTWKQRLMEFFAK